MVAIMLLFVGAVMAFVLSAAFFKMMQDSDKSSDTDEYTGPGPFTSNAIKIRDSLSTDSHNLTYCQKCKVHMYALGYNQYKCKCCGKTIRLTVAS